MQRIGTAISSRCRKGRCSGQEYLYNQCERRRWYDYRSAEKAPQMQCIQRIRRAGQHSSSTNRSVTRLRPEERLCNHRILKPSIFQSQTTTWNVFLSFVFFYAALSYILLLPKLTRLPSTVKLWKRTSIPWLYFPTVIRRQRDFQQFTCCTGTAMHGTADGWDIVTDLG